MFRLLRTAATAWRLPEATTALNHTMQTSSYCSQPNTASLPPPFTGPSTIQETTTKWLVWEVRELSIPNVVLRDGARDLLLSCSYRLRHGLVRHCTHVNPHFQDMFDELLKCNTEAEVIQHIKDCPEELFPDDIQA